MHCIQLLGFSQFNQLVALSHTLKRKISKSFCKNLKNKQHQRFPVERPRQEGFYLDTEVKLGHIFDSGS